MFKKLYNKTLRWSAHPYAGRFLMGVSFIESSCFPIPPDVMLAPMVMAKPEKAWNYALLATIFSVLGGVFGYIIGVFAYGTIVQPLLEYFNQQEAYAEVLKWFNEFGVVSVVIAAFTPIPYKLFTIGAGVMQMNVVIFIVGSLIGRGARFFLVAGIFKFCNKNLSDWIQSKIDIIGWITVVLVVVFYYFLLK